jgi:hypothetical protein
MEIIRIPKRYRKQIQRLPDEGKLWIFESLMLLADGQDVELKDSFSGDVLEQIWRECCLMEKKNVKSSDFVGGHCLATHAALTPHAKGKESKVKESKVKERESEKKISPTTQKKNISEFFENFEKRKQICVELSEKKQIDLEFLFSEIEKFTNYWTEQNQKGKKRWEAQEFFDLNKRFASWVRNCRGPTKSYEDKKKKHISTNI